MYTNPRINKCFSIEWRFQNGKKESDEKGNSQQKGQKEEKVTANNLKIVSHQCNCIGGFFFSLTPCRRSLPLITEALAVRSVLHFSLQSSCLTP